VSAGVLTGAASEATHPRLAFEDRVGVALVAGMVQRLALFAGPPEPPDRLQAPLELRGQIEQVLDVLARVGELLGAEGSALPAREARALGDAHAEHVPEQRLVGGLRAEAREAGRELRVEHV